MEGDIHEVDSITSVKTSDKENNNNNLQASKQADARWPALLVHIEVTHLYADFEITNNLSFSKILIKH